MGNTEYLSRDTPPTREASLCPSRAHNQTPQMAETMRWYLQRAAAASEFNIPPGALSIAACNLREHPLPSATSPGPALRNHPELFKVDGGPTVSPTTAPVLGVLYNVDLLSAG